MHNHTVYDYVLNDIDIKLQGVEFYNERSKRNKVIINVAKMEEKFERKTKT